MKVGDYVRTKQGIEKIKVVEENFMGDENCIFYATDNKEWNGAYNGKYNGFTNRNRTIIKSSPNIIELIQVGDYVNGIKITSVYDDDKEANDYNLKHKKCLGTNVYDEDYQEKLIYEEDIKSIVIKEQFESMEYRIGE